MPVTSVTHDPESLTMTVVADFDVPVRRLWDAHLDPRQLERFWGAPSRPAVFTRHDGYVGGRSEYTTTGPDGDVVHSSWDWVAVDELKSFEVHDGEGRGVPGPARMVFAFEETGTGSRLTATTRFGSLPDLERVLELGPERGVTAAAAQIDAVLADLADFAAGRGTTTQILSDTQVRISRIVRGSVEAVWRAHQEPALLRQWLLGPDGWTMPVCEVAAEVGGRYRNEWESVDGTARFGFTGTLLESRPPQRSVTTESMIGVDGPECTNELTLTAVGDGTLLSIVMTFPDAAVRDGVLGTGMTGGMETSYARLESLIDQF